MENIITGVKRYKGTSIYATDLRAGAAMVLAGLVAKNTTTTISQDTWKDYVREGMQTILAAIDMMKNGKSVCIFPEGSRNKEEGTLLPFHEGSFKIAVKSGCPIVPMTINNSAAIFENQFPFIKRAHVIIEYGKPVCPKELPKENQKHLGEYVSNIIMETYNKNKERI